MKRKTHGKAPAILYRDDHILVVNKPSGLLSVAARGDPVVVEWLKESGELAADTDVRIVHRLDKETSGVMLFALHLDAQRELSRQFMARSVEKTYLAIVRGLPKGGNIIDLPLSVDRDRRIVRVASKNGKPAQTDYLVLEHLAGHALVECRPRTGRLHQIRVHMAAIGYPLAVDPLYGGARALFLSQLKADYRPSRRHDETPLIERVTLHAAKIAFDHPADGSRRIFEAPLPRDFSAALNQLRRLKGRS